jgi:hypothetical protein
LADDNGVPRRRCVGDDGASESEREREHAADPRPEVADGPARRRLQKRLSNAIFAFASATCRGPGRLR